MVIRYNHIFTSDEYRKLIELIKEFKWIYGGTSTTDSEASKFWYSELMGHPFFVDWLDKIQKVTNKKFTINRLYANGQTLGQDGSWHVDSHDTETGYTFLYYLNDYDDVSLIGETYFMVDGEPVGITPIPNSAIIFPHNFKHKGMAPRKGFNDLRVTIAFKLTEIKTT